MPFVLKAFADRFAFWAAVPKLRSLSFQSSQVHGGRDLIPARGLCILAAIGLFLSVTMPLKPAKTTEERARRLQNVESTFNIYSPSASRAVQRRPIERAFHIYAPNVVDGRALRSPSTAATSGFTC